MYRNQVLLRLSIPLVFMSPEQISIILASVGLCLGVLICFILLLANKSQVHANRLLTVTVFGLCLAMLQAILIYTGDLLKVPHFFRIPSPFFYLSLATGYLYVRSILNDETKYKKFDLVHFLPAFLHVVELMPFYLKSATEKRAVIDQMLHDPAQFIQLNEGLLPPYAHNLIRALIGLAYVIAMTRLMIRTAKEGNSTLINTATFNWLKWFIALMGAVVVSIMIILLMPEQGRFNRTLEVNVAAVICFVILNFYLFFRPQILYGIPRIRLETVSETNGQPENLSQPPFKEGKLHSSIGGEEEEEMDATCLDYLLAYKPVLEEYLNSKKPYLEQGYNVARLSYDTGIPQHHLSALLNKVYGVRFNDFINQYRIKYITEHFDKDGWRQMTLEGIASEVGFNSRTTFFNAIKKSTGLSPSEYISQIRKAKGDVE